jgi:sulfane dehydrogenase subunit SoxC
MGQGPLVITGVAWSGRGTIKRVDVSIDGGRNWQQHGLTGQASQGAAPLLLDINWDGSELLLQSRAIDDHRLCAADQERASPERGENSIYHNNGIQTWHVNNDGVVENVEVS